MDRLSRINLRTKAFTLIELLVVIAIIAILAAILFPVFAQAKEAAKKTTAISYFKQTGIAMAMYGGDFDDGHPMSNSGGLVSQGAIGWGYGTGGDTVPFQQMYPYIKNTQIVIDPMDPWQSETQRMADELPYMGATLSTATPTQKLYSLGVRSNIGYNYAFFSPWRIVPMNGDTYLGAAATTSSQVGHPANTLMWGTSIWDRDSGGSPKGGGNWVIETPCWLGPDGNTMLQPMKQYADDNTLFSYGTGWSTNANDWLVYGGLWPFYNSKTLPQYPGLKDGRVIMGFADGHVAAKPVVYALEGCSAYGAGVRRGTVTDLDKFIWDFE